METPERIKWAVKMLNVQAADEILEIGCGHGFALRPICQQLVNGRIAAIDRSQKMVDVARKSNVEHIEAGKAEVLHADFLEFDTPARFDKVFLFNLNVFWMDPKDELSRVNTLLKPGGKFYLFHQPPPGSDLSEYTGAFHSNLNKYGFGIVETVEMKLAPVSAVCVISRPS
jgi:SAM-dependent methyltransferase